MKPFYKYMEPKWQYISFFLCSPKKFGGAYSHRVVRPSVNQSVRPNSRSRSQHDLAAKSCPVHNFIIWSRMLQLFNRNDHHIKTTCRVLHLGRYLEGQGHSMTLQQNHRVCSRILQLFHRNDHHIETTCHAQHLGCYLEGQGQSTALQQNRARPITLLFEVEFYKYFTEMITILRRPVANKSVE
jgi:hypothetical protein